MAQEWSGAVEGEIVGGMATLELALSNIDGNAPDGLTGPTEIELELRVEG